jgi:hypothetical protein
LTIDVYLHPDEFPVDVLDFFSGFESSSVEFSVTWYKNLTNSVFPNDQGVRFYILRRHGQPVAALPIVNQKYKFCNQLRSLGNYYTSCYSPLLEEGLKVAEMVLLLKAMFASHAPLGSVRFAPMDPGTESYHTVLTALRATGLFPFTFFCFGNWYYPVDEDWLTYYKNRDGVLRSTIKRMKKKFASDGGKLELVFGGTDLARGLAAYEQVYSNSWKVAEPHPQFIPGLMQSCSERGWLRLGLAWLNGVPIASQLWIVANGKANIFKLAYDEQFKAYAPGTLLTAMLMEYCIEVDRVAEIDYLIGDDPYKKAWMNQRRERWGIVAYDPKNIVGLIELLREIAVRTLKSVFLRVRSYHLSQDATRQT